MPQFKQIISSREPLANLKDGEFRFARVRNQPDRIGHMYRNVMATFTADSDLRSKAGHRHPIDDVLEARNTFGLRALYNGTFKRPFNALVTSDGATVTMTITNVASGDLILQFSDGDTAFTSGQTIALTAGSDASPTDNFIYILESDKILTKSTSGWPSSAEHNKVAYFLVPSAGFVQTNGVYVNQNWNDFMDDGNNQGHLTHMAERSRLLGALYFSGIAGNGTDGYLTPAAGNVELKSTAGVVYQMHRHTVPAFDTSGTDIVLVKNWSGDAYHDITNLYDITKDSGNNVIGNNKYFNLVIWGVANKTGEFTPMFINLPSGFYNTQAAAEADNSGFDDFVIPHEFNTDSSTGFLVARVTIQMKTGGGTWIVKSTVDLRGATVQSATGGAASQEVEFADNVFAIFDEGDNTKILNFDAGSNIGTGVTVVLQSPSASGILALTAQTDGTIDASDITAATFDDILVGTGLDVANGADTVAGGDVTISLDLTEVIATDAADKVLTSDADGTLTAEANLDFDGSLLAVTGDVTANGGYLLEGYSTGRNVLRAIRLRLQPGATPNTNINVTDKTSAGAEGFNGPSITDGTNIAKAGSSGSFALSADGLDLTMDITEAIVGIVSASIVIHNINNSSTTETYVPAAVISSGNMIIRIRQTGNNTQSDLTAIMDAGDLADILISFVTSS